MPKARVWPKIGALVVGQGRMGQVLLMTRVGYAIRVILAVWPY